MLSSRYEQNKEAAKDRARAHYWANRDRINADRKMRRASGLEKKSTESVRQWRKNNPEKALALRVKKYGITAEQYQAALDEQKSRCKICGETMTNPNTDHNHKTGAFRGLLCTPCNTALGLLKDDVSRILSAAAYLQATNKEDEDGC